MDRDFQLRYALRFAALGGLLAGVFGAMLYWTYVEAISRVPPDVATHSGLDRDRATVLMLVAVVVVVTAVVLALFGILMTHRVAGPVLVMGRYLDRLARGEYPTVRPLRKHDELRPFFDRLHSAVDALRHREQTELDELRGLVQELASSGPSASKSTERLRMLCNRKEQAILGSAKP